MSASSIVPSLSSKSYARFTNQCMRSDDGLLMLVLSVPGNSILEQLRLLRSCVWLYLCCFNGLGRIDHVLYTQAEQEEEQRREAELVHGVCGAAREWLRKHAVEEEAHKKGTYKTPPGFATKEEPHVAAQDAKKLASDIELERDKRAKNEERERQTAELRIQQAAMDAQVCFWTNPHSYEIACEFKLYPCIGVTMFVT